MSFPSGYFGPLFAQQSLVPRFARTTNIPLSADNNHSFIDVTAGTFTQDFPDVSQIKDGFCFFYRNSGTGEVTIRSSDGTSNWKMYSKEARFFQFDGGLFRSMVIVPFSVSFTNSGTFTKPPGYSFYYLSLIHI